MKKLYRSKKDVVVGGVLGGLGEYTDTDPTLWRLGFVLLTFISHIFPAIIVYIIACIIIPKNPAHDHTEHNNHNHSTPHHKEEEKVKEAEYKEEAK